jgi:hypothetical protein
MFSGYGDVSMSAVHKVQKHHNICIVVMETLRQHVSCTESKYILLFSLRCFQRETEAREAAPIVRLPSRVGKHRQGEKLF